jgi:DNA (cytosine-5)-methyltransferase 1
MRAVELFAGAGGLALGTASAGFKHDAVIEWDKYACDTLRENKAHGMKPVAEWPIFEGDVRLFDYASIHEGLDLVAGGPPCQPFSLGGKHMAHMDERDMFPAAVRAVRHLQPRAFLFENVKGLVRQSFSKYFEYIRLQLTYPEIDRQYGEEWPEHHARLERYHTKGRRSGLWYRVVVRLLNAADYGVPQRRERVFIVGFRSDVGKEWCFPTTTHSHDALLYRLWVTGEYWDLHKVAKKNRPPMHPRLRGKVRELESALMARLHAPWVTIRDALSDLPDPGDSCGTNIPNHFYVSGARSYQGHTGSPLDEPAKTLKAGDHGVPGGENTLVLPSGEIRYFTVRESARLQTFPDEFLFHGSWTESMRQLGNAVPVRLAQVVASGVRDILEPPHA